MGQLEIRDLEKVYNSGSDSSTTAVEDLSITVEDGDFVVFVGPSGCGKSTTLRCIAGLETLTDGDIILDGESITDSEPKDRDIAMVFQNYALYPHKTAFGNMSFGLQMSTSLSDSEIEARVNEVAELMGIEELLAQKPDKLSGGQQQRVALGRAIVREPEVFLMDEPLSNLDAKLRTQMRTELQSLQRELNTTTVYVTHDQTEAMTMGDKIVILDDGELQQMGTPLECYHEPSNEFVAGFIGSPSMNFVSVRKRQETLHHSDFSYDVPARVDRAVGSSSADLLLGIRPEDIELTESETPNSVSAVVRVVEPMGDVTILTVELGDVSLTVSIDDIARWERGEQVEVVLPPERLHVFDTESGEAVVNRRVEQRSALTL
jgi:multiple sugar transport system ATP-binding protein